MGDWHKCSEAERTLIESCGPDETCILFGENGLLKLKKETWFQVYGEACGVALSAAMTGAGVDHDLVRNDKGGWSIKGDAEVLGLDGDRFGDLDFESSTVTIRVRTPEGREGTGVARLVPPGVPH